MLATTAKTCGSCTMCCKLMSVVEIEKGRDAWCRHAVIGRGCNIYERRPQSCRSYNCLWLMEDGLGDHLRPDKTKTVLLGYLNTSGQKTVVAICDAANPAAWRSKPIIDLLRLSAMHGHPVFAAAGRRTWQVFPGNEVETDGLPDPALADMQAGA